MTEKRTTNPESLTPEERKAVLERSFERRRREFENELIARQLAHEAQEEEARREAS